MTRPTATYRLQFRDGMTFARATALVGYLARLGISHLYASPLFAAVPGSGHGYDGIDFAAIEPAIGGEDGFAQLSAALDDAGLGLLLDFVPNHMAASDGNGWWRSVLEWGAASPHAQVFDVDWSAPRLVLPILGVPYGEALRSGTFAVVFDAGTGSFALRCYDRHLPLTPPSYAGLLQRAASPEAAALAQSFAAAAPDTADALKRRLADLARTPAHAAAIANALTAVNADRDRLDAVHAAQVWRLAHWPLAREALTYRRFFEIADLVCLRVEDPAVFDAVHARLLELVASHHVDGIRLDHIDGLADPKRYLERLQQHVGAGLPFYLLVEKILEPGEDLRPDWPVAGTTGYEFIAALAGIFVDRQCEAAMSDAYHAFIGGPVDYAADATAAKGQIFTYNLAAELAILTSRAHDLATDAGSGNLGADSLRRAIVALAAALPVYRTYVDAAGPDDTDRQLIDQATEDARSSLQTADGRAVDFVARLLRSEIGGAAARGFVTRFQQTTGPVMAKAIEDTMFYRYNRLIGLNEVGGAPDHFGAPLSAFHAAMTTRRATQAGGLSATATHDTKRGEDARARLYGLSEMPAAWWQAVERWAALNAPHRATLAHGVAPEPAMEWHFYQALAGAWPAGLGAADVRGDEPRLAGLRRRMSAYFEKAAREAKQRTSWLDQDTAYEHALSNFVTAVLSPETGRRFLQDFAATCAPLWCAGAVNSLAQLAIKLTAPGVPDFYQGAELWDLSLVDPDNRAPVDFASRQALIDTIAGTAPETWLAAWTSGAPKLALMLAGLAMRSRRPALFAEGAYTPLAATGAHSRRIVAFARALDGTWAVTIVSRFALALLDGAEQPLVPPARWGDTAVTLPTGLRGRGLCDLLTGAVYRSDDALAAVTVLARFPIALLVDADEDCL